MYYEEKVSRGLIVKGKPAHTRKIYAFDGGENVGVIWGRFFDEDGSHAKTSAWDNDEPYTVQTESKDRYGCDDGYVLVGHAKTVAEGKKLLSDWFKKHPEQKQSRAKTAVKQLPASPNAEFWPTPSALAGKMASLVDWTRVETILEPSAGKGDLVDCAMKCYTRRKDRYARDNIADKIDTIEADENLRAILKGKEYRVVADDFLTFATMKHYDLILMNPPFSNGDEHLLKALSMQKDSGGQIVCLLNAETIRNPYTMRRQLLKQMLANYGARIEFISDAFRHAERKSDVEVAIVSVNIPAVRHESHIWESLKRAAEVKADSAEVKDLVAGDWLEQLVSGYQMEAKAGVALMNEFNALAPYIMDGCGEYKQPMIGLKVNGHDVHGLCGTETINGYLQGLRSKYWFMLFNREELTSRMTSDIHQEYIEKVNKMKDYDFSRYNVEQVIREISAQLSRGVEESIYKLFDEMSAKHSWYPECANNVHYYNGWATNEAHKVGMKVILPINGFYARYDGKKELRAYNFAGKIADIERALNYLDRGETACWYSPESVAHMAEQEMRTTMDFTFFSATFYKKGTCHLKFNAKAARLIDRLNIFAARGRNWLPPDYGKKRYEDLDEKSREVIDSFQGKAAYDEVMRAPDQYIIAPGTTLPLLTA